ncbi:MAG: F0F1 ATP synthase subunit delta [Puniceicoccales bacterium]|jgi:hypothetical protein|nr:F0F1 ATP synthase subunit delta [Puniceicoccales bacterium]
MLSKKRVHSAARRLAVHVLSAPEPRKALSLALAEIAELGPVRRLSLLQALDGAFRRAKEELASPSVEYAGKLATADRKNLERWLSEKMGRAVRLAQKKNPDLLGGVRLSVGDRRWELSVRSSLAQFLADTQPMDLRLRGSGEKSPP